MTKALRTQFVLVDGARARWVTQTEGGEHFATVQERNSADKDHIARFDAQVAEAINAEVAAGEVDRLVLVGSSHAIAAVRRHLSGPAEAKIAHTLAKDLTHTPDHDLGRWLRSLELG